MAQIKLQITSVLGGISPTWHYGSPGQFLTSLAIDPEAPYATSLIKSGGVISPTRYQAASGAGLSGAPMWFVTNAKNSNLYTYASDGELISYDSAFTETVIGTPTSGVGNGAAYYNDYIYLATPTDISRYGPLSGTPTLTNTVWTGATLGTQTALINTTYPSERSVTFPNHAMHVHVDNKLYLCDYVTGQGRISYVQTNNTGTNDGTTRNALALPFGYMPVDVESFGNDLAILAISEGNWSGGAIFKPGNSALFLWDTVSSSFYKQINILEPLATALLNVNGEIYIWSGQLSAAGVRLSKYSGGDSLQPILYIREGTPPCAGAVDSIGNMVAWGAYTTYPSASAGAYSLGYRDGNLPPRALNHIARITNSSDSLPVVSAIKFFQAGTSHAYPMMGWRTTTAAAYGIDRVGGTAAYNAIWLSEVFNLGQEFTVNNVRLTFPAAISSGVTITPTIGVDDVSATTALTTINSTNYTGSERIVDIGASVNGKNNFYLQLAFTGTTELPVNLPITITVNTLYDRV